MEASETVKCLVRDMAAAGCAILLTTHQLDVAEELSDRVAIIRQGQIIAEQPTHELIQQFSGSAYRIDCGQPIDDLKAHQIAALGGTVTGSQVHFSGNGLYELLDILRPLPIKEIRQDRADLTDVFLSMIRDMP